MTKQIIIGLAGTLVIAFSAHAAPIESYGFEAPKAGDSGDTLRTLSFAGEKSSRPATDSLLSKSGAPATRLATVTPGARMPSVLVTQPMKPPSRTAAAALPTTAEAHVVIDEPHMALLMLAGLLGLIRRRS